MAKSALQVGDDVARTMASVTKALAESRRLALREIGKSARKTMMDQAPEVPGGDRRFSRMARYNHGGRLGVTFRVRNDLLFIGSKGPWKLAETGAAAHQIGGWRHPGTRQGRSSWTRGADVALAHAERELPEVIGEAVEEAFGRG